jgi:hypothetical protein
LLDTCDAYNKQYKYDSLQVLRDVYGKALVEQKFMWPYMSSDNYEVVLCGTIDFIGLLNGSEYVIVDHKTTAVYKQQDYLDAYLMSVQLKFYKLMIDKLCKVVSTNFADRLSDCGCMINGIFISKTGAKFARSDVFYYSDKVMLEFEQLLNDKIKELIACCEAGTFPATGMITDSCNSAFGKCPYFYACSMPDEDSFNDWLTNNMTQKDYNPMMHGELEV